ncbi:MAG: DUF4384 domain-containing protein [Leptospiraceae bacterium]|nr:DUF4384 domain-containing protein [Leptospiraceae bacterium]MCK6379976.1 DUF4384 domain-containing protein [Leptospiraceae bacterium]NUM40063.1 DUF4384 domain-containing protein [Leptospiraceae bacterium]
MNKKKSFRINIVFFVLFFFTRSLLSDSSVVGVMPFEGDDKKAGEQAAAFVLTNLSSKKKFKFVEKGQLTKALNEITMTKSGIVKEDEMLELGKIHGASYLILGEVRKEKSIKELYFVSARLIKTETGNVIGANQSSCEVLAKCSEKIANTLDELLSVVLLFENPDSPYIIKLKLDKGKNPTYKIKEKVKLTFRVESKDASISNCYIKIFSVDKNGSISQIYPNKFSAQKSIALNKDYTFPEEDDDFEWEVTAPTGYEYIQAITSGKEAEFSSEKEKSDEIFRSVGKGELKIFRGIKTVIKKEKLKDFSAERVMFQVVE